MSNWGSNNVPAYPPPSRINSKGEISRDLAEIEAEFVPANYQGREEVFMHEAKTYPPSASYPRTQSLREELQSGYPEIKDYHFIKNGTTSIEPPPRNGEQQSDRVDELCSAGRSIAKHIEGRI